MKHLVRAALCALSTAVLPIVSIPALADAPPAAAQAPSKVQALQQVYAGYNQALLEKDGIKAAGFLHSNIRKIYGEALELAKSANREQLKDVPAHKKLIALYLRWAGSPQEILAMRTPDEVIAFMVSKGALRTEADVSTDLRDFEFKGKEAFAYLYSKGRKTDVRIRFAQESRAWKVDLTNLNLMADDIYAKTAEMQKITVDEALLQLIGVGTQKPVTDEIWTPLNERKAS